ncbi:hypothetical protein [Capnocytophaga cynodegmi]|uniref:hypothetical protein n=1 Tax=Capnocytophaga cynodegmi TaxID=28189 RepID=UPI00385A6622
MLSEEKSKKFIREFIKLSGKAKNVLNEEIEKIGNRATHIVSTFFIGHYIYQNTEFKNLIDEQIGVLCKKWQAESSDCFSYIWFLTCLFHDLGYAIEKEEKKYNSLEELKKNTRELKAVEEIPNFYNKVHIGYYEYHNNEHSRNDHGITAAYLMYNSLCKVRKIAEEYPDKTQGNLFWGKELENIYNFCAWNILAHNIWFCSEEDKDTAEKYKKYKLDELILSDKNRYKIELKKYPFFFFLCLVDTIEPYKRVQNYKELKKIKLSILKDGNINIISYVDKYDLKIIESLKEWLIPITTKTTINISSKK